MKVSLISILKESHRNLSCLSLYSLLTANNIETKLLFIPKHNEYNKDEIKKFIFSNNFDIVGISVMTDGFYFANQLTYDIKEYSKAHIIWGGIHPTLMPEECLSSAVDSICVGEGETTLLSLIDKINKKEDYSNLSGIGIKLPNGEIKINSPPPLIDIKSLPFNKFDLESFFVCDSEGLRKFSIKDYIKYSNYKGEDYTLMASRGCPYNCSYCCNSSLNKLYPKRGVRRIEVDKVIDELKYIKNLMPQLKFINFIDDQFSTSKECLKEFAEKYKREINLSFLVRFIPGTFDDEEIKILKDAGLSFVQMGIQSGSEKTNKEVFNRRFDREAIINSSKILSQNGIYANYDIIIQNEFEEEKEAKKTIQLLLELEKPFSLNVFTLTAFPNTKLDTMYKEKGIIPKRNAYDDKNYFDYDKDDFYFQLVRMIPYTTKNIANFFFENSDNEDVRFLLKQYFEITKERRNEIVIAQDKNYHPPTTLKTGRGDFTQTKMGTSIPSSTKVKSILEDFL